jgi:phosphopantetheinyl transferase (holo-ACP synthase)
MQTNVVPRREKFGDVYPDLGEDESDVDENVATDDEGFDFDDSELQAVQKEEEVLNAALVKAQDAKSASLFVLQFMTGYGKSMESTNADPTKLDEFLQMYIQQRTIESERARDSDVLIAASEKTLVKLRRKRARLEATQNRAKEAALKAVRRSCEQQVKARQQRQSQKRRDRLEKKGFWTDDMGQVVVYLDGRSSVTPETSRQSSVTESATHASQPVVLTLNLTYIIPGPSWAPRYNLKINTPSSSASLTHNADFNNNCSETWKDAKVTLSTSHASFSGLDDPIPILHPWHITTAPVHNSSISSVPAWQNALRSPAEMAPLGGVMAPQPRAQSDTMRKRKQQQEMLQQQAQLQQAHAPQASLQAEFFSSRPAGPGCRPGRAARPTSRVEPPEESWTSSARRALGWSHHSSNDSDTEDEYDDGDQSCATMHPLERQDSLKQDIGLTTTYELPGLRTLAPSTGHRSHTLSKANLESLTLTHVIIPKIRAAAFLRARIKNTSSANILRGKMGISVDGTFLGTSTIPSCAPNNFFNISLGVDPNILVTYAKPSIQRATSGFFNKENAAVFRRSCWVKNTKSTPVDIIISDQIPLKDNEQVRIQMIEPKGLEKEGDEVDMGLEKINGKGKAVMMRNGEVKWFIRLEAGKDGRIVLAYQTRVPVGTSFIRS